MGTIIKYSKNKNHISPSSEEDTTTTLSWKLRSHRILSTGMPRREEHLQPHSTNEQNTSPPHSSVHATFPMPHKKLPLH